MTVTLYGIKNCDTVKKARAWLAAQQIDYRLHDFRSDGLAPAQLDSWLDELGWEALLNKRSTSWRQLPQATRQEMDATTARAAMLANPTLIKRPLLDTGQARHLGFSATRYAAIFSPSQG